ncbi:two-component system alkaline phosphatase synthesis response regulator PhoP [Fusobacterium naviforme]|uniref:Stage 0 sporulation protein A homolog n=1 Tax=Moryella indoligenes TaxID=371674 RepID=A0AAE3V943_9FIRM|nr:response regulator transcription factor [Moryella indoligenes]KAB0578796.1 response regulator transcription factor [Fusobacterium naviforme]MDQ0151948.1 two-component system alkaline phosphatase synthesis response regulator PhoP [Moryella indoligenes]PSL11569.1 two-component system alkaline phosphatase synthesis response regulator PhoP [Fusobacterium naviforme]STO26651.1 Phosphate regulon transcriptional regulatory protein phoB [Fusobacterium naviforme]
MIWCVEDDANIRDIEVYTLNATGLGARGFSCSEELFAALEQEKPELIILDIMMPGEDGVETLRRLRACSDTGRLPVIMATAKGSEFDKIQSLDLGADDYLVKPFGMMEMVSRVKAVLRRCQPAPEQHILKMHALSMNLDEHTLTAKAERIQLTFKEFELLRLFLTNPGRVFTRDQLFIKVWGMDHIAESRTVDMHIRTLRQKLGDCGKYIETIRNVGYRMRTDK